MNKLQEYVSSFDPPLSDREWAELFECSRSLFCQLRRGQRKPGRELMGRIARQTDGDVPLESWYEEGGG